MSDSVWPHRWQPTRLRLPWDSPGKNTGVCCHFLLQCMKVKSESEVAQSCPTLSNPMDCSPPGSSIRGIFQARVLEWGAMAFSDEFSVCWILTSYQLMWYANIFSFGRLSFILLMVSLVVQKSLVWYSPTCLFFLLLPLCVCVCVCVCVWNPKKIAKTDVTDVKELVLYIFFWEFFAFRS